jgi:hypothetical protein
MISLHYDVVAGDVPRGRSGIRHCPGGRRRPANTGEEGHVSRDPPRGLRPAPDAGRTRGRLRGAAGYVTFYLKSFYFVYFTMMIWNVDLYVYVLNVRNHLCMFQCKQSNNDVIFRKDPMPQQMCNIMHILCTFTQVLMLV